MYLSEKLLHEEPEFDFDEEQQCIRTETAT